MLRFFRKRTQPPLAEVARRGADELARWRNQHPDEPLWLVGADLTDANLSGADLSGANLTGALLDGASLADAKLHDAVLREASLRRANLSAADGLLPQQLAGADLTGASLPDSINVERMEEAAKLGDSADHARMIFLWMLGGCAFVWLMLISTTQLQLLANDGVVRLPLFDVDAPSSVFFLAGPFLLIAVFHYMHVYMQRMWETLASLPAVFPDGESIDRKTHGWMLLGLVRWRWRRLRGRPSMFLAQTVLSLTLGWGLVPITVFSVWRRCAIRHQWETSIMQAVACALVVFVSLGSFDAAWSAFRRGKRLPKLVLRIGLSFCLLYCLQGVMYATFDGQTDWSLFNVDIEHYRPSDRTPKWGRSKRALAIRYYELSPFATHDFKGLRDAVFTEKDRANLDTLLKDWREAYAEFSGPLLTKAHLEGAKLNDVDFSSLDATGSFWNRAQMLDADLTQSQLAFADFTNSQICYLSLIASSARFADFSNTEISYLNALGADLTSARFVKLWTGGAYPPDLRLAVLNKADLTSADLVGGRFQGASLKEARLEGAVLLHADFSMADLRQANLRGADLRGANLTGANLTDADLTGAKLGYIQSPYNVGRSEVVMQCTDLSGANITRCLGITKEMRAASIGDPVWDGQQSPFEEIATRPDDGYTPAEEGVQWPSVPWSSGVLR